MAKALVIVESPAKARTISKYLGEDFVVESSIGHVRDLPATAAEIPAKVKDEPWARLGVDVDNDFAPVYVVPNEKKAQVTMLRKKLKDADALYLATDEDREGEAIAWHLQEVLKPKVPVKRMVFGEITHSAITDAVHKTRDIDARLVGAQEARRILDRLYGYEVSPVLWRKVRPKLSAGRVQSVATRLIVDRERSRMAFVSGDYWSLESRLRTGDGAGGDSGSAEDPGPFTARLAELDGTRVASGRDFDEATGKLRDPDGARLLDEAGAKDLAARLETAPYRIAEVKEKPFTNRPYPPFITSTLQQEAGRKLRFGAQRTMRLAQSLYENGYITYMRTDSTHLSGQAVEAARSQIRELYGERFLPGSPRKYKTRSKSAQEAHEAIRPAGESFRTPQSLRGEVEPDALRLYELIWMRTVASQMKDASGVRTSVRIEARPEGGDVRRARFATSGKVIRFAGFLRAYVEGSDDPQAELADQETILPPLAEGQALTVEAVEASGHQTQPPARYTEASLVKELEEKGIGRPSTYASIIQTIQDRGYVWKKGTTLIPTFTAFAVTKLLELHLASLVDPGFTARMEDGLDAIASGESEVNPWLRGFYFGNAPSSDAHAGREGLKALVGSGWTDIDAREVCSIEIGTTEDGEPINARVGRFGPYLQVGDGERASIPDDLPPDELTPEMAQELLRRAAAGDKVVGTDPETGKPIYVKNGRFGAYVQLGDPQEKGSGKRGARRAGKPKMASLWPSMDAETLTLDEALLLLSFPREVGAHPETGQPITVQDGRFGPYVKMGEESRSLGSHEKLATVTLEEAIELLKQPKGRGRRAGATILAELGKHPDNGGDLQVKTGRFGPYVTDGVVNATIPKSKDPAALSLEEGLELLAAREQKLRDQGKDPRAPKPKRGVRRTSRKK